MSDELIFQPVTDHTWPDFEALFEAQGGPSYCWCTAWRKIDGDRAKATKADRKRCLRRYVADRTPIGILAYDGSTPVAWCSIAPRESYTKTGGDTSLERVWSLTCFFVRRTYRGRGISEALTIQAIHYAKANGASYVEAYPVDPQSPSYRFMGFRPMFERLGFTFKHKAESRRYVMVRQL